MTARQGKIKSKVVGVKRERAQLFERTRQKGLRGGNTQIHSHDTNMLQVIGSNEIRSNSNIIVSKIHKDYLSNKSELSSAKKKRLNLRDYQPVSPSTIEDPLVTIDDNSIAKDLIPKTGARASLQYVNESQNLPDLTHQLSDGSSSPRRVSKSPLTNVVTLKNKIKAKIQRKPRRDALSPDVKSAEINLRLHKRTKSALPYNAKNHRLNWRGVPKEAPREERKLQVLRTAVNGEDGALQLNHPAQVSSEAGLDLACIEFDKHLRKAFQKMVLRNQVRPMTSAVVSKPYEMIQDFNRINIANALIENTARRTIETLSLQSASRKNSYRGGTSKITIDDPKSPKIQDFISDYEAIINPKTHGAQTMENAVIVQQKRYTLSMLSNAFKQGAVQTAHYSTGLADDLLMVKGTQVQTLERKQTLDSPQLPQHEHKISLDPDSQTFMIHPENIIEPLLTLQDSSLEPLKDRKSSDPATELITVLRSSDSEKAPDTKSFSIIEDSQISQSKPGNAKHPQHAQELKKKNFLTLDQTRNRKQLSSNKQLPTDTSLLVVKVEGSKEPGLTERQVPKVVITNDYDQVNQSPTLVLSDQAVQKQQNQPKKTKRTLTFGGVHEIDLNSKGSNLKSKGDEVSTKSPPVQLFQMHEGDSPVNQQTFQTPHMKDDLNQSRKMETSVTETLKTDSSFSELARSKRSKLDTVIEASTLHPTSKNSPKSKKEDNNFKKTETMAQTDFPEFEQTPTRSIELGDMVELESAKLWLLKYESLQRDGGTELAEMFPIEHLLGLQQILMKKNNEDFNQHKQIEPTFLKAADNAQLFGSFNSFNFKASRSIKPQPFTFHYQAKHPKRDLRCSPQQQKASQALRAKVLEERIRKVREQRHKYEQRMALVSAEREQLTTPDPNEEVEQQDTLKLQATYAELMEHVNEVLQDRRLKYQDLVQLNGKARAQSSKKKRIIINTQEGGREILNPTVEEVLSDPSLQQNLEVSGQVISQSGLKDRAKMYQDLYQVRKQNLKYRRRSRQPQHMDGSSVSHHGSMSNSSKGSTTPDKQQYFQNTKPVAEQRLPPRKKVSSTRGLPSTQTMTGENAPTIKAVVQRKGVTFESLKASSGIVNIEGNFKPPAAARTVKHRAENNWDPIREVDDISKDHTSRNEDNETVYLQKSMIIHESKKRYDTKTKVQGADYAMLIFDSPIRSNEEQRHANKVDINKINAVNQWKFSREFLKTSKESDKQDIYKTREFSERLTISQQKSASQGWPQNQLLSPQPKLAIAANKKASMPFNYRKENSPDKHLVTHETRRLSTHSTIVDGGIPTEKLSASKRNMMNIGLVLSKQDTSLVQLAPVAHIQINRAKSGASRQHINKVKDFKEMLSQLDDTPLIASIADRLLNRVEPRVRDVLIENQLPTNQPRQPAQRKVQDDTNLLCHQSHRLFTVSAPRERAATQPGISVQQPRTQIRPQTSKNGQMTHRDRKLWYLQFKRVKQQNPLSVNTDSTSIGINHFLSETTRPQKSGRETSQRPQDTFFKQTSCLLSALFRDDQTSANLQSSMRRNQTQSRHFGIVSMVPKATINY